MNGNTLTLFKQVLKEINLNLLSIRGTLLGTIKIELYIQSS